MFVAGSVVPNHDSCINGDFILEGPNMLSKLSVAAAPAEDDSMVKSQYGRVSFGFTCWRLCSNVLDSRLWLVKNPRPSWNWL